MTASRTSAWWRVIDWRTVLAVGVPAWLLVLGLVAWCKLSPKRSPSEGDISITLHETAPLPRLAVEISPMPRPVREVVVAVPEVAPAPHAAAEERLLDPAPVLDLFATVFRTLTKPTPAPVAAPAPTPVPAVVVAPPKPVPAGCKTHGTAVHFVKSTLEAAKQAKAADKLVFVLHLSGNIEDPGFT